VVLALELLLGAVAAVGEPWRAVLLVGQVGAVAFAVALELGLDAVAGVALEPVLFAGVPLAVLERRGKIALKKQGSSFRNKFVFFYH
jgi:hypothetical protein